MSKVGKILFIFGLVFFISLLVARLAYGGWAQMMWVPLSLTLTFLLAGFVKEFLLTKEFMTLKTTKHGMNMGVLILLAVVALACANYFAVRFEKKFDMTSEGLFSLSEQSLKVTRALDKPTEVVLIYRPSGQADNQISEIKNGVRDLVDLYENVTKNIKYTSYDALRRPDLAEKYQLLRGVPFAVYVVQEEKKIKVDPVTEEGLTRALIRLKHNASKTVYFTMGHGERALEDNTVYGLSSLKDELAVTYDLKPLVFFESGNKVPDNAAAVVIAGPDAQFLEVELQALRDYARRGGKLVIAADPMKRHNLAQLTKSFGIEFQNNHVLDRAMVERQRPTLVVGSAFSKESDVTKTFGSGVGTVFDLASAVKIAPDAPKTLQYDEIVRTHPETMSLSELTEQVIFQANGPHTLAISVKGKLPAAGNEPEGKEFFAVVFGDSDFLSNSLIFNSSNRDLIANAVAWLSQETDLISIRPKSPKGTQLQMSDIGHDILVAVLLILLPIVLFSTGGLVWWRRRTA